MRKELHLHLDDYEGCICTYIDTLNAVRRGDKCIHTTITSFLSFEYSDRIFVHFDGESHEITIGECDGTKRIITKSHKLWNLLMAGEFEWYKPH